MIRRGGHSNCLGLCRRTSRGSQVGEVLQQAQADALAFFGVELRGEQVVSGDGRDEGDAVFGASRDDGIVVRDDVVAVDEVDVRACVDAGQQ